MELEKLQTIWSDYDKKLDKSLQFNLRIFHELNFGKTKARMRNLMIIRILEAVCFLIIVVALWKFIAVNFFISAPTISAFILSVFSIIGFAGSISQIALMGMIDYAGPVTHIQKQLATIKSHSVQLLRLLILSIPFYMSYTFLGFKVIFDIDLYPVADPKWLIIEMVISIGLIIPTLWLYRELGLKPIKRAWIKQVIENSGGKQIMAAVELLNEIKKFENETI